MHRHPLELLSPARDSAVGRAAIDHGADAVYIGAPRFGARAAAGNTIEEIQRLIDYAHRFDARVYVALNTLLTDDELCEATAIAHRLFAIGADALIIQDMGLLECDLPPIPLHASTQCDNRTIEKVRFLEAVGFSQVVLARELSLEQIAAIRKETTVPLECFVHGALCVAYSGRCRISEVVAGRSANRGECAQFCRHRYTLRDGRGHIIKENGHLLSLKDLDLSHRLRALIDVGVSSFKIEGRLKDAHYVKNVTAFYRLALDAIIDADDSLRRLASGRCRFAFTPDPARTFHRGATEYFLMDARNRVGEIRTPKSIGKAIGRIRKTHAAFVDVETTDDIANGDGLCFFDARETLVGMRVNRVENGKIFPQQHVDIPAGTVLYRNLDAAFIRLLAASSATRTIAVTITITKTREGIGFAVLDEDGCRSFLETPLPKEAARNPEKMREIFIQQAKKSGDTIFRVQDVWVEMEPMPHLPVAAINALRRKVLEAHLALRIRNHTVPPRPLRPDTTAWPPGERPPAGHILNQKAREFFSRHGLVHRPAEENGRESDVLMTCRYCLKRQLGHCPAVNGNHPGPGEPWTLSDNTGTYALCFDCRRCEMSVLLRKDGTAVR